MSDTDPRCPKCCSKLTWLTRGPTSEDCTLENDWQLTCSDVECGKHVIFLVNAGTEADCIRQATNLELLDRKVRKAVDAEIEAIATVVYDLLNDRRSSTT